jgi:hypothetical protein
MYITNFKNFLYNETGDNPLQMPQETRERASFFAMVIDITTKEKPATLTQTDVSCFENGCDIMIKTALRHVNEEINWYCPKCGIEGVISNWQGTKWDNR